MLEFIFCSFFKLPAANLGGYYNNYRIAVPLPAPKSTRTLGFYRTSARSMFKSWSVVISG